MLSILSFSSCTSLESVKFEALLVWFKDKDDIDETSKNEMLNAFDLNKFDKAYLLNKVRRTGYFSDEAVFDVLEVKVAEVQRKIHSLETSLNQVQSDLQRAESKNDSLECEVEKWSNINMNKFKKNNVVELDAVYSRGCPKFQHQRIFWSHFFSTTLGLWYKFDKIEFINNIKFKLEDKYSHSSRCSFSYSIELSVDGNRWATIADFSNCRGEQNVYFAMQDMMYLGIRFTGCNSPDLSVIYDSVVLMLDTKSGVKKNKTS